MVYGHVYIQPVRDHPESTYALRGEGEGVMPKAYERVQGWCVCVGRGSDVDKWGGAAASPHRRNIIKLRPFAKQKKLFHLQKKKKLCKVLISARALIKFLSTEYIHQ